MRRVYGWLAAGVIVFTFYGSLLPFNLRPRPIGDAWSAFQLLLVSPRPDRVSRTNFIANVLLFVPVGFCLMGARLAERPGRCRVASTALIVLTFSVLVSTLAEFLQMFAPGRIASPLDIFAQAVGCIIGIAAWISAGPSLTHWVRESGRSRHDRLARALTAYAALWAFVTLAPFDITVDVGELGERLRSGLIVVVPFASPAPSSRQAWNAVAQTLSCIPIGMLAVVGWRRDSFRRSAGGAWVMGAAAVVAVEVAQVFIQSHAADATEILFGWLGVALGVWAGTRLPGQRRTASVATGSTRTPAIVATLLWAVVICGYHWQPFDFGIDRAIVRDKLAQISLIPFDGYRRGSELSAFSNLLSKIAVAVPLGLLAASAARTTQLSLGVLMAIWIALAAAFFGVVEAGQLFVPSRVPDPTDVLMGVAASLGGLWLGRWLQRKR
jgi:VanZ family protein